MKDRFEGVWSALYLKKLAFKVAMYLLVIGGLNWLFIGLFDTNLVAGLFGKGGLTDLIYVLVGISAITIMLDRDTYLPFLGPMVAPCSVLQNREPPGATKEIKVVVTPNTKVLYWAAEPASEKLKTLNSWKEAYLEYENAGVATSNGEGVAILKIRAPQPYKVPSKGRLESHLHYRICEEAGWMGRIHTLFLNQSGPEGFENQQLDKNYKVQNLADSAASIY
jgi:uncharacterized membrane protein YuzA (DUF378 family)